MDGDNPAIFDKKPENPRIEFAHMAQLKEPVTEGLGQRLPVILAIAQFRQPRENWAKSSGSLAFSSSRNSRTGQTPAAVS
jgi:hypothetical protein